MSKQILKITLSLLFIAASFTSCVDDKDFETPQIACESSFIDNIPSTQIRSIQSVAALSPGTVFASATSDTSADIYMIGYVISDDKKGNFYKELYIQDDVENPTAAIKLNANARGMYAMYPFGSKIAVKLNGLAFDRNRSDENVIGEVVNGEFASIRPKVLKNSIMRSCETSLITPIEINSFTEINDGLMGKHLILKDAEFEITEAGEPMADSNENFDTHRSLIFCNDETEIKIEISSFANFKDEPLTDKKFDIKGVLSKDYRGDFYVLKINSTNDIMTNNDDRCGATLYNCDSSITTGANTIFEQDFEGVSNEQALIPLGWKNINNGGSHIWNHKSYNGNKYMQLGAYGSNEDPLVSWLVTPAINLDNSTDEVLTFDVNVGYYRGKALFVYASTDFTGDVTTAHWQLISNFFTPVGPNSGYGSFQNAGKTSLDCLSGDVYIAFQYKGAHHGISTTMQIDNIKITGNN